MLMPLVPGVTPEARRVVVPVPSPTAVTVTAAVAPMSAGTANRKSAAPVST